MAYTYVRLTKAYTDDFRCPGRRNCALESLQGNRTTFISPPETKVQEPVPLIRVSVSQIAFPARHYCYFRSEIELEKEGLRSAVTQCLVIPNHARYGS